MKSHDVTGNVELLDVYDGLGSAAAIPPFQDKQIQCRDYYKGKRKGNL